jgi:hypothetical protein
VDDSNSDAAEIAGSHNEDPDKKSRLRWSLPAGVFLFLATAVVVVWQNSRLAVLWDLSYILENSYRIALGYIPYRDFVLPYAPLTFVVQAALIKLTGRVFFHHVLYCAGVGGFATVLTWRIILNILRGKIAAAEPVAFLLSVPLIVLGIYCIFPHPFYDPDCTFVILVCIYLLQTLERSDFPPRCAFFVGALLVIPLFVKQNTGLAFLASTAVALALLTVLGGWREQSVRGYVSVLVGAAAGLAVAVVLIHFTAGVANYAHWTIEFAASRRLPPFKDMLGVYQSDLLLWWITAFALGTILLWFNRRANRALAFLSILLISFPFAWMSIYLLIDGDSSEQVERLLAVWPFLLIVSGVLALASTRRRAGISMLLPFIVIGAVHGAFLSQQVWGSTYAIWPLFMILLADAIEALTARFGRPAARELLAITAALTISMTFVGGFYVWSHERLDYANVSEGEIVHSSLPSLAGLSVRGPWIPQFEELVRYSDREIPREAGILMIPGEDLFYYGTGRHPRFPVLMFDHTVNPYTPEEVLNLARARQIQWLVVKRDLQLETDPVEERTRLLELLRQDFEQVESLDNYDIYRRK